MARLSAEMTPYDEDIFDFMGKKIEAGTKIVYASLMGRSARLTLGEVIGVYVPKTSSSYNGRKFTIKVQPVKDSTGGNYRFTEFVYDEVAKKGEHVERKARPVFLQFSDRLMVLEQLCGFYMEMSKGQ